MLLGAFFLLGVTVGGGQVRHRFHVYAHFYGWVAAGLLRCMVACRRRCASLDFEIALATDDLLLSIVIIYAGGLAHLRARIVLRRHL